MPYIGNEPSANFTSLSKQDLTGSSGASITLSHAVANAEDVALYINNVRQEPTTSYTTNGNILNFVNYTVSASDDIYVLFLGKAIQTTVPPDGSVGTAKIASSAVDLTSKVTGVLPVANGGTGYTNNLAWHFTIGDGSSSGAYIADPMDFNFIQVDTHNIFSTSTNKITIPRTGLYFMTFGGIKANTTSVGRMHILKNNNVIGPQARGEENSGYAQMYGAFTASLSQGDVLHAESLNAGMWTGGANTLGGNDPHWSGFYIGA